MKIQQIAVGVYLFPLRGVNVYLLKTSNGLVLIDTGNPGNEHKILDGIKSLGHSVADLKTILITHSHLDHAGSAAAIKKLIRQVAYCLQAMSLQIRMGLV